MFLSPNVTISPSGKIKSLGYSDVTTNLETHVTVATKLPSGYLEFQLAFYVVLLLFFQYH